MEHHGNETILQQNHIYESSLLMIKISRLGLLLLAHTCHVLKFRKDTFRDVKAELS